MLSFGTCKELLPDKEAESLSLPLAASPESTKVCALLFLSVSVLLRLALKGTSISK